MVETGQGTPVGVTTPRRSRRWLWLGGGLLAGAAALAMMAPRAWAFRGLGGHGFGGHGHGRGAFAAHLVKDPAAAKEHVAMATEFVLRGVDATAEQKQKAREVTDRMVDQMGPLAQRHHELHGAMVRELAKPQIDRAAIERIRQQGIALADEASKVAVTGVADLGDVLTPEQRAELIEFASRLRGEGPRP